MTCWMGTIEFNAEPAVSIRRLVRARSRECPREIACDGAQPMHVGDGGASLTMAASAGAWSTCLRRRQAPFTTDSPQKPRDIKAGRDPGPASARGAASTQAVFQIDAVGRRPNGDDALAPQNRPTTWSAPSRSLAMDLVATRRACHSDHLRSCDSNLSRASNNALPDATHPHLGQLQR